MLLQLCDVARELVFDLYLLVSCRESRLSKFWGGAAPQPCSATPLHWLFGDAAVCEKEELVKCCHEAWVPCQSCRMPVLSRWVLWNLVAVRKKVMDQECIA